MSPGYNNKKKQVKKQQNGDGGCMSAFLQQFLTHKRLPPPPVVAAASSQSPVMTKSPLRAFESNQYSSTPNRFSPHHHAKQNIPTSSLNPNGVVSSQQHRSPSVIGRLMGLDPLPNSQSDLQRSISQSRDLFHSTHANNNNNIVYSNQSTFNINADQPPSQGLKFNSRRTFFDSEDIFPDEIEKRLKMRGIDQASKDLDTLKQILEALQLKGLLHSRKTTSEKQSHPNFVHDQSPVVVMKPTRLSTPSPINQSTENNYSPSSGGNQTCGTRGFAGETPHTVSTRRSNSLLKPKPLSIETQKRVNETMDNRRVSPIHTPKSTPKRNGPEPAVNNRLPRTKKVTAEIHQKVKSTTAEDESSSISESSSITTSADTERSKAEEYKDGRTLLQRCDKLLNSIAEMNAIDTQPSPVSVLDYKDESLTPSPVMIKHNIDFKETDNSGELEDGLWGAVISPIRSRCEEISHDSDYAYISDVLRASHFFQEDCDVILLLEKQQHLNGKDTSKVSRLQRKLIFDTTHEILDRNRRLPPWKAVSWTNEVITKSMLDKVWSEFQRIRERNNAEDLFETICGVLKKDLEKDGTSGWGDRPVEMSEVILDMERLIFKDLISETIRDLAALASRTTFSSSKPRRKLVF